MTLSEAMASYNGSSGGSKGLTAEEYRSEYRDAGEEIRWFKAYQVDPNDSSVIGPNGELPSRNGYLYVEQDLDPAYRVLITTTKTDTQVEDLGEGHEVYYPKGSTQISCLPDEIELGSRDRVILINRNILGRHRLNPSGESSDQLPFFNIVTIDTVIGPEGPMAPTAYEIGDDATSIVWTGDVPDTPVSIELHYRPQYLYLRIEDRTSFLDHSGVYMPQRGILTAERRGNDI